MKFRLTLLSLLFTFAFQCWGIPLDAPVARSPELTASDMAWADGKVYVKGLLPDIDGHRISSVQLDFVHVDGSRKTIVAKQAVEFPSHQSDRWNGISGELLILLEEVKGETKIFMGVATLERSTQVRVLEDLGGSSMPGVVKQFAGRTGNTTADLRYTVPVGESEVFQFVDDDGEYYGSLVVVAAGEAAKPISTRVNSSDINSAKETHSLTLRATGSVYVLVKERGTNEEVHRGTLVAGDHITLEPKNGVDLLFTAGEHLILEWDGDEMKPNTAGTAKISLK